jgi:hypothetical protein
MRTDTGLKAKFSRVRAIPCLLLLLLLLLLLCMDSSTFVGYKKKKVSVCVSHELHLCVLQQLYERPGSKRAVSFFLKVYNARSGSPGQRKRNFSQRKERGLLLIDLTRVLLMVNFSTRQQQQQQKVVEIRS